MIIRATPKLEKSIPNTAFSKAGAMPPPTPDRQPPGGSLHPALRMPVFAPRSFALRRVLLAILPASPRFLPPGRVGNLSAIFPDVNRNSPPPIHRSDPMNPDKSGSGAMILIAVNPRQRGAVGLRRWWRRLRVGGAITSDFPPEATLRPSLFN